MDIMLVNSPEEQMEKGEKIVETEEIVKRVVLEEMGKN